MAALLRGLFLFLRPSVCLFSFPPGPVRLQGSRMSLLFMSLVFFFVPFFSGYRPTALLSSV